MVTDHCFEYFRRGLLITNRTVVSGHSSRTVDTMHFVLLLGSDVDLP